MSKKIRGRVSVSSYMERKTQIKLLEMKCRPINRSIFIAPDTYSRLLGQMVSAATDHLYSPSGQDVWENSERGDGCILQTLFIK